MFEVDAEGLVASAEGAATAHPACGAAWAAGGQVGKVGGASEMGLEGDARERERERAPLAAPRAAGRAEAAEAAAEATNRLGQARCAHVLPRKGRRCGLTAVCGEFCAAHARGGDRVACMHCGTPVASAAMEKHVRKCPAAVRVARRDAQPWHSAGINRAARRGVAVRSPALTEFSTCELRAALEKTTDKASALKGEKKKLETMTKELHAELKFALETGEALHKELDEKRNQLEDAREGEGTAAAAAADAAAKQAAAEAAARGLEKDVAAARSAITSAEEARDLWMARFNEERGRSHRYPTSLQILAYTLTHAFHRPCMIW